MEARTRPRRVALEKAWSWLASMAVFVVMGRYCVALLALQ
jgi:hypothetical protein